MAKDTKTESGKMEFDGGQCAAHNEKLTAINASVEKLIKEIFEGNGNESLKARMRTVETNNERVLLALEAHVRAEKENVENKAIKNLKIILQTAAIIAAFLIAKYVS